MYADVKKPVVVMKKELRTGVTGGDDSYPAQFVLFRFFEAQDPGSSMIRSGNVNRLVEDVRGE